MTKKDFIVIADTLLRIKNDRNELQLTDSQFDEIVNYFIASLSRTNERFDMVKFDKRARGI